MTNESTFITTKLPVAVLENKMFNTTIRPYRVELCSGIGSVWVSDNAATDAIAFIRLRERMMMGGTL